MQRVHPGPTAPEINGVPVKPNRARTMSRQSVNADVLPAPSTLSCIAIAAMYASISGAVQRVQLAPTACAISGFPLSPKK